MKILILLPYCPLPVDSGAKAEMWKHLRILRDLGDCTILSAADRPVGAGWTPDTLAAIGTEGFNVILRDDTERLSTAQRFGVLYAAFFKAFRCERAFGHSNPYHRLAFPLKWWKRLTSDADLAVIMLSFWARLPTSCPKAVVLLDLWSARMWEGPGRETAELAKCDLVFVISKTEEALLNRRGVTQTLWNPPAVSRWDGTIPPAVGLVGSDNPMNIEGLRWLESAGRPPVPIRVYGRLAAHVRSAGFERVGPYADTMQPYRDCGIILFTTREGTGVQIKSIEAIAAGRAIVERRGAIRGLPAGEDAWRTVDTPNAMLAEAATLLRDEAARTCLAEGARKYYTTNLDASRILDDTRRAYESLLRR